jgi:hypothetical protein
MLESVYPCSANMIVVIATAKAKGGFHDGGMDRRHFYAEFERS